MIDRMAENDEIVTRYMNEREFQASAFPILAREIFEAVRATSSGSAGSGAAQD
jgi:type I restriction enzyme R subunit